MSNNIPEHVLNSVRDLFSEDIKNKLQQYLYEEDSIPFDDWFELYLQQILDNHFSRDDDGSFEPTEIRNHFYRKKQNNKKNWVKTLRKDIESNNKSNPISNELEVYKQLLVNQKTKIEQILEILPVKDLDNYSDFRLEQLEQWAKDKKSLLSDYSYLHHQKPGQIERAFEIDFSYLIAEFFKEINYNGQWNKIINSHPLDLLNIPWAEESHMIKSNLMHKGEEVVLYNDYIVGDNVAIRTMFAVAPNERVYFKNVFALDDLDSQIIEYTLEHKTPSFYTDVKTISIDLNHLGRILYNSDGGKNIELTKQRLRKIARYSQEYIVIDENDGLNAEYIVNIFQEVTFDEKTQMAHIMFSERIHQNIINNQTIQVYSDVKAELTNSTARTLIYALQKERIEAYIQDSEYIRHFDYSYFAQKIRFRSKKSAQNLSIIEKALSEFKDLQIIIKSFERKGTGFEIEFIPLTESEKIDYFNFPKHSALPHKE